MLTLNLTLANGKNVTWTSSTYKIDDGGVVVSFAVEFDDGTHEVYVLMPTHVHHSHVPRIIEGALDTIGGFSGYTLGKARGVPIALVAGAAGVAVTEIARIVVSDWFGDEVIDDGDYYDRFGKLLTKGLITVKR